MPARAATLLCALTVLVGCGSGASLPPAPEVAQSSPQARLDGGATVRVDAGRRRLVVARPGGETLSAAAGFGPTHVVVGADDRIYVVDTAGGAVLLFRRGKELKLVRRAALPGRPYAAAIDRERGKLWVTVMETDEVVQLTADGAPRVKRRLPTVRRPNAIAIEGDRLTVQGESGQRQVIDLD